MKARKKTGDSQDLSKKRLLSLDEGAVYLSLGRTSFRTLAEHCGAVRHYGKRILFDRVALDAFISQNTELKA